MRHVATHSWYKLSVGGPEAAHVVVTIATNVEYIINCNAKKTS